jgi:magnesium chelatase family protein
MAALSAIPADADHVVLGELNLDGTIAPVAGALPAAIGASAMGKGLICPAERGSEAAWAGSELDILAPRRPDRTYQPLSRNARAMAPKAAIDCT